MKAKPDDVWNFLVELQWITSTNGMEAPEDFVAAYRHYLGAFLGPTFGFLPTFAEFAPQFLRRMAKNESITSMAGKSKESLQANLLKRIQEGATHDGMAEFNSIFRLIASYATYGTVEQVIDEYINWLPEYYSSRLIIKEFKTLEEAMAFATRLKPPRTDQTDSLARPPSRKRPMEAAVDPPKRAPTHHCATHGPNFTHDSAQCKFPSPEHMAQRQKGNANPGPTSTRQRPGYTAQASSLVPIEIKSLAIDMGAPTLPLDYTPMGDIVASNDEDDAAQYALDSQKDPNDSY